MITVKRFVFNSVAENTYVIWDHATCTAAIIDCGASNREEERDLTEYIEQNKLNPLYLLNTHMHFDHCWGNNFAAERWGLTPHTARQEIEDLPSPGKQVGAFGMDTHLTDIPTQYIQEGDSLPLGSSSIQVLSVPGHSPGHLAFYSREGGCVFTGDALFYEEIGRCDLWGGSLPTLLSSVRSRLFALPAETVVYSGHGPQTTIGHEIKHNPYFQ